MKGLVGRQLFLNRHVVVEMRCRRFRHQERSPLYPIFYAKGRADVEGRTTVPDTYFIFIYFAED